MDVVTGTSTAVARMLDDTRSTVHKKCHSSNVVMVCRILTFYCTELVFSSLFLIKCTILKLKDEIAQCSKNMLFSIPSSFELGNFGHRNFV